MRMEDTFEDESTGEDAKRCHDKPGFLAHTREGQ
jgi:hypothetical protein